MATIMTPEDMDLETRFARLREMSANADARYAEATKALSEARYQLPRVIAATVAATAALIGATVGVISLILP